MKPNEGRLQTGEHILAKIIEKKVLDSRVVIARFDKENKGSVDFFSKEDLRKLNLNLIERAVNDIIKKEISVFCKTYKREEIEDKFDLSKIPEFVDKVRIVDIEGFDRRPCRDPHVKNTNEIGYFEIIKLKKVGKERYRFIFQIKNL